jgi:nitrate/nitrite transport system substrate-binding protein
LEAKASAPASIPDFQIFHFLDKLDYLPDPNNANYLWHSHATWVLTQMVRWNQLNLFEYPKDADKLIAAAYPQNVFSDVAKAVGLNLPKETMKKEADQVFIDKIAFDPSQPVEYINASDLRTSTPTTFGWA